MSLNQIVNPIGLSGLDVDLHNVQSVAYPPLLVGSTYAITSDDLKKQRMLICSSASDAITVTFPSSVTLLALLPKVNDSLELMLRYRSTTSPIINSADNLFAIQGGTSVTLINSNGSGYISQKFGITRTNLSGTLRIY